MSRRNHPMTGLIYALPFIPSMTSLVTGIVLIGADNTHCMSFLTILHWSLIVIAVCSVILSVMAFVGACYHKRPFLFFYFSAMPFVLGALLTVTIAHFVLTAKGSGRPVINRAYPDYYLQDYSGWLKKQVTSDYHWGKIRSCILDSKACAKSGQLIGQYPENEYMYYFRHLNPIQSGCCKPPTECRYTYVNETVWNPVNIEAWNPINATTLPGNIDCFSWSNDQFKLCYDCDSCKAGVLATLESRLKTVAVINIFALIVLTITYAITFGYDKITRARNKDNNYCNRNNDYRNRNNDDYNWNDDYHRNRNNDVYPIPKNNEDGWLNKIFGFLKENPWVLRISS